MALSESVLILSPAQITAALKDCYRLYFQYSKRFTDLLAPRLEAVKAEVKAGLEGDIATKQALQKMLQATSMPTTMKAFIEFLVAD